MDELGWPLVARALSAIGSHRYSDEQGKAASYLATCHHAGCLQASMFANDNGKHSVAVALVRQSIESLSVVEIGLQDPDWAGPILEKWNTGRISQGELRQLLEKHVWPLCGNGLWNESWSEFRANMAKTIQPYAHYTTELQGWQYQVVEHSGKGQFLAMIGLETYDPVQATRVTLFHALLTWILGRILLHNGENPDAMANRPKIDQLGQEIAQSNLLFHGTEWWTQFAPHMMFKNKDGWKDT